MSREAPSALYVTFLGQPESSLQSVVVEIYTLGASGHSYDAFLGIFPLLRFPSDRDYAYNRAYGTGYAIPHHGVYIIRYHLTCNA